MRIERSRKKWPIVLGMFVCVALFSFLVLEYKSTEEVGAASLAGFDPGYIISDYQMGNYNSMNEGEIQNFLSSKNGCGNRDYGYYLALSSNPNYRWHFENGHFICLSEERFGHNDNEIGFQYGESAAHIIWQAAQDYRINPQVLLVLLQKETGLITDPIPNNGDYRKATGYGCPDTAACSSQYYGFRNQVRNAAALFRTVLDGGWTNYPLGNNYIQYNPNGACGGSIVNVRSRATSALYRYTPYQPNAGALAAGYGTASCGAYGNRNFYLYFEDWFGGITKDGPSALSEINKVYTQYGSESGSLGRAKTSLLRNEASGIEWIEYDNGFIVGNEVHGYHISMGPIRDAWVRNNWEFGPLGFPTSDIIEEGGKKYQWYEGGVIVGNDRTGYYISVGTIRDVWNKYGSENGVLGFPITDILINTASGIRWQEFEHGFIVGNDAHGYHISMGPIRDAWVRNNWEFGPLGFPTSDIIEEGGKKYQWYEGGKVLYTNERGAWIEY